MISTCDVRLGAANCTGSSDDPAGLSFRNPAGLRVVRRRTSVGIVTAIRSRLYIYTVFKVKVTSSENGTFLPPTARRTSEPVTCTSHTVTFTGAGQQSCN
jgi:hypothetical protein